jgi:hypothetical protein
VLLRGGAFVEEPGLVCDYDRLDAVADCEDAVSSAGAWLLIRGWQAALTLPAMHRIW